MRGPDSPPSASISPLRHLFSDVLFLSEEKREHQRWFVCKC